MASYLGRRRRREGKESRERRPQELHGANESVVVDTVASANSWRSRHLLRPSTKLEKVEPRCAVSRIQKASSKMTRLPFRCQLRRRLFVLQLPNRRNDREKCH
jgi:hypothetical protein